MDLLVRLCRHPLSHAFGSGWVARRSLRRRSRWLLPAGWRWGLSLTRKGLGYHVYANTGSGRRNQLLGLPGDSRGAKLDQPASNPPCHFKMGVRTFDPAVGLEEQNVDAVIELILDINGNDVTRTPAPPLGLRAFPIAGAMVRVEWSCPCVDSSRQPLGFHVYLGTASMPDYTVPVSTVAWSSSGTAASLPMSRAWGTQLLARSEFAATTRSPRSRISLSCTSPRMTLRPPSSIRSRPSHQSGAIRWPSRLRMRSSLPRPVRVFPGATNPRRAGRSGSSGTRWHVLGRAQYAVSDLEARRLFDRDTSN